MFMLHPNALFTSHNGQSGGRGLSPRIWTNLVGGAMSPDGASNVFAHMDDFLNFGNVAATGAAEGYAIYMDVADTVGAVKNVATEVGGAIVLKTPFGAAAGDNDDVVLVSGGNTGVIGKISDKAGESKLMLFEARVKFPSVTDGDGSVFIGLGEEGCAASAGVLADSNGHTLASKDLIGFFVSEADRDSLKFVYRKAGQAMQTLLTVSESLAANTWYKIGFVFDPAALPSKRIKVYVDNVEQDSYVTADNIAATTFPDGEGLALVAAIKNSANNDPQSVVLDWWGVAQAG